MNRQLRTKDEPTAPHTSHHIQTYGSVIASDINMPPVRKRRRLDFVKCRYCRQSKQKCTPSNRRWPGQKCERCVEKRLSCSEPVNSKQLLRTISHLTVSKDQHDRQAYAALAEKSIRLMSKHLRQGISSQKTHDAPGESLDLPTEVQQACLNWVQQIERSSTEFYGDGNLQNDLLVFLKQHFTHWLEVLSAMGNVSRGISMLVTLEHIVNGKTNPDLNEFVIDARWFTSVNKSAIEKGAVEIHYCLLSAPRMSIVKSTFLREAPIDDHLRPYQLDQWAQTLKRHTGSIYDVTFSPDGTIIASASSDCTIMLWDVKLGHEYRTLDGHTGFITRVAFSPDGTIIASASWDKTIKLWNVKSGHEYQTLSGHTEYVNAIDFSPDGTIIASGSGDKTIKLWNIESGHEYQTLRGHTAYINAIDFSPDGKMIASASTDETIKLWNVESGHEYQTLRGHTGSVYAIDFSPDGKMIASASTDETIKLWNVKSGHEYQTLRGHTGCVNAIDFSPDGKMIASASRDETIKLWNIESGHEYETPRGHTHKINAIDFSPDETTVASSSSDRTFKLWDVLSTQDHDLSGLDAHSR